MDLSFLYLRKKFLFNLIIFQLILLNSFIFAINKSNNDFDSETSFNDIIKFDNKNYTSGSICINDKNTLIIEYSDKSPGHSRLFYSLKENGRGYFENEEDIREINITSCQYYYGKKIFQRYDSMNAFVSLESDEKKEKQYLLSISSDISLTEVYDIETGFYQQWLTTDFLSITDKKRYIYSRRFSFLEWNNTNIYFLVYIQNGNIDPQFYNYSYSYTINKFSLKKENDTIKVNILKKIEDKSMYNCSIVSATIVDVYDVLIVGFIEKKTFKLTLKFYDYNLTEINSCIVDPITDPGNGVFFKILHCKDDYIAVIFYMIGTDDNSIKLKFIKISKTRKIFSIQNIYSLYSFGIGLKNDILLNDFYKIKENRFIFISTIEYTQLFIAIIETGNNYRNLQKKIYIFDLGNIKFYKDLSIGIYKGFLLFTSAIKPIDSPNDYSSYLIFFGYANGTDFSSDISPYFADIQGYDSNKDFVTFLLEHASIDNNIFSYNLVRKVKLIFVPEEILIYHKDNLTTPITDESFIEEGNYILYQNKEIIKTNKLYELKYQYIVQEPISYIDPSYSNENEHILFGRVNKLSMKLCHDFCETCYQLGISNDKQFCLSCLEPYTYDYFKYFNIFMSNCVPEGYYNDRENGKLIECKSTEYKYYYNKTDNNKKICFKYDYECPTSYSYFDLISNECSNYIYDLYEDLPESYTTNILSNLISIINAYVFLDIAKNPQIFKQNHTTHTPIDLIETLKNVKKEKRNYYEFYREIREIIGSVRDIHFNIISFRSFNGKILEQVSACIPFKFIIDKDIRDSKVKVYIKYYEKCSLYYNDDINNYIKSKSENQIPLKFINGQDPFDYIQNWGRKYFSPKSPHGHFSFIKNNIHSFYFTSYPLIPEELKVKYEFESNNNKEDFIILDYYILVPNFQTLKKLYNNDKDLLTNFNENKFNDFFKEEMKKYINNIKRPNIFEIIDEYNNKNFIFKENIQTSKEIKWDYQTKEQNGIKCRVDNINQVNVFLQQSFMLDLLQSLDIIYLCTELFHNNNYPIIGIENQNGGGYIPLAQAFHQLLQIKTQNHMFFAGRSTEIFKNKIKGNLGFMVNIETCKPFLNLDYFMEGIIDDYSNKTKNIIHKRTKIFNFGQKPFKKWINNNRKKLKEKGFIKRPTDIIIFTDGFSFSATSLFLKQFQKTGGAITVGFNGNPKLSDDLFDASQSPTNVVDYQEFVESKNLFNMGYYIIGISFGESFSDNYNNKNAIPLEYDFDLVDERVDIYNEYSDEIYQSFIDKGKEIFKKYNQDKKCNKKNKRLLFDPNDDKTCYNFKDDIYAHGGYECGRNGYWDETVCKKYYCDFGYYFDVYENKCKLDMCINDPGEVDIYLEGKYDNVITLNKNNNKEYIFNINNNKYIYFFRVEGDEGYIHYDFDRPCPNLCVVSKSFNSIEENNIIHLNYFRNATNQTIVIHISSVEINPNSISSLSLKYYNQEINNMKPLGFSNFLYIFQGYNDYISFFETDAKNTKIKCAIYESIMTDSDILNINENYFFDCNSKLNKIEKGKIFITSVSSSNSYDLNKPIKILLQPLHLKEDILFIEDKTNLIFLNKSENKYYLDFSYNSKKRIIQLSRSLKNAEIEITNYKTWKTVTLDSNDLYYTFEGENDIFTSILIIKVKEDTLIEFMEHFPDEVDILEDKEYNDYKIKGNTVIKFDNNALDKIKYITIYSKTNKSFKYGAINGYTLGHYFHSSNGYNINLITSNITSDTIEVKMKKINLMEGEYFYLMLIFDQNNIDDLYQINLIKSEKFNLNIINTYIPDDKCKLILSNSINLIKEGFVYDNIFKNQERNEYFLKTELISELKKIEIKNRKFFDFYRDIKKITSKIKVIQFNISPSIFPNNYDLNNIEICLPFSFYIKGNTKESSHIFIEINEECFPYFTSEQQKFIISHFKKYLLYINKTDPFDFIQNLQSEFNPIKNKQAQFGITLEKAHKLSLMNNPFTNDQISNIEFVFEGGDNIYLDYYINYKKNNIDKNNIIKEENKDLKEWIYSTRQPNGFKCLVDKEKKVNVFILGSLKFHVEEDYLNALEVIFNCTNEFYNNSYPIIGIENDNNEGEIKAGLYLEKLLQIKLSPRTYFSMKNNDLIKNIVDKNINSNIELINTETCEPFNNFDEIINNLDDYRNKFNQTKFFQIFNRSILNHYEKQRKEIYKLKNLKRPTDIIIFTDGFSLGASNFLIKGLQERGGAIIAGYKGNPKSNEIFYGTVSEYSFNLFPNIEINNDFDNGFTMNDFSYYLSYNDSYKYKNMIPREYYEYPVDEKVNIYHKYNDSFYDEFVDKALEIFDKYNNQKKCNKYNLLLTYDPNDGKNCFKFDDDEHAHGGYQCNQDGIWSDICIPYYCDFGYIFDTYYNKCIKDICINESIELSISKTKSDIINPDSGIKSENEDFPACAIALITVSAALILLIIIIVIIKCFRKNNINLDIAESLKGIEEMKNI